MNSVTIRSINQAAPLHRHIARASRKVLASALLVFSQEVLNLQVPFAIVSLLLFTTSRKHLRELALGTRTTSALWVAASVVDRAEPVDAATSVCELVADGNLWTAGNLVA